ncbi:hypothetical protein PMI14_03004 [Acidovorax sp. CF316]|nr:hypothetical protein PMI14_03004 [Acidovorax sp. CF316]
MLQKFAERGRDLVDDGAVVRDVQAVVVNNNAGANSVQVKNLPVGDYPVVIADQGLVIFQ